MHLGVVKVRLLQLAKPEVISQCIIFTKKNSMLDRTLTTPNMDGHFVPKCILSRKFCLILCICKSNLSFHINKNIHMSKNTRVGYKRNFDRSTLFNRVVKSKAF